MKTRIRNSVLLAILIVATAIGVGVIFGGHTLAEGNNVDVPSGVPTETTPDPVQLSVPDTTLTVNGCSAPNAFVTLFENNQPIGTVVANANARFSKLIVAQTHGLRNIKTFYEDSNGRTSASITRNVNLAPHSNTNLPVFLAPTIDISDTSVFVGDIITFFGSTAPFATINVTIDNNTTVVARANSVGSWSVSVDTEDYFIGTHVFRAVSALPSCGTSEISETRSFRVTRPDREDFLRNGSPGELKAPIITEPQDGFLAGNPGVLIIGESLPNAQIEILVDDTIAGSVFANSRGEWTFPFTMTELEHYISARMCIDGACSDISNVVHILFRGENLDNSFGRLDGCKVHFQLKHYRFFGLQPGDGTDLVLEAIHGTGQYEMVIDWGDTTIEHFNIFRENQRSFHHVFKETGQFNGTVTIKDANDCIFTQYISIDVLEERETQWLWLLLVTVPPSAIAIFKTTKHLYRIRVRYID